jgi:hypothetical protein
VVAVVSSRDRLVALSGVLVACAACSSGTGHPTDGGVAPPEDSGKGTDAGVSDAGTSVSDASFDGPTITVSGVVTAAGTQAPLAGATVCQYYPAISPPSCVTTDADGNYALTLPANANTGVTTVASGYFPEIEIGTTPDASAVVNTGLLSNDLANVYASAVGGTFDPSKGQLIAQMLGPNAFVPDAGGPAGLPNGTIALSPASGAGPFYSGQSGLPNSSLTSTTTSGQAGFLNVDPGQPVVSIVPEAGTCTPILAWPGSAPNTVTALVAAGYLTRISVVCQ